MELFGNTGPVCIREEYDSPNQILPYDPSFMEQVPQVILAHARSHRLGDDTLLLYIIGEDDLKPLISKLLKALDVNNIEWRSREFMCFYNTKGYKFLLSMVSFKSEEEILSNMEWVLPITLWGTKAGYYTLYSRYCNEVGCSFSMIFKDGIGDSPHINHCRHCSFINSHLMTTSFHDGYVDNVLLGIPNDNLPVLYRPEKWDDETMRLSRVSYDLGLECGNDLAKMQVKFDKVCESIPRLKSLLTQRLPFEYIKPLNWVDYICPICLIYYKPIWSWSNMKYYKDEAVSLYLVLSERGLMWDLVLKVLGFIADLNLYNRIKVDLVETYEPFELFYEDIDML